MQLCRLLDFEGAPLVEWDGAVIVEPPAGESEGELYLVEAKHLLLQSHVDDIKHRVETTRQFMAGTGDFFHSKGFHRYANIMHIAEKKVWQSFATRRLHVVLGGPNVPPDMRERVLSAGYICAHVPVEGACYSFSRPPAP